MSFKTNLLFLAILVAPGPVFAYTQYSPQQAINEAAKGNPEAQAQLGLYFYYGQGGFSQDLKKASEWLTKSADKGNDSSQAILGQMYIKGDGVAKDIKKGLALLHKSAERQNSEALKRLAVIYTKAEIVEPNSELVIEYLTRSSDAGDIESSLMAGIQLLLGDMDQKKLAQKHLFKAANRGNAEAQLLLGKMYLGGHGVDADYPLALKWLSEASRQNMSEAQFFLGSMYENGIGVLINRDTAKQWYKKAMMRGNESSKKAYDALVSKEMKLYK